MPSDGFGTIGFLGFRLFFFSLFGLVDIPANCLGV